MIAALVAGGCSSSEKTTEDDELVYSESDASATQETHPSSLQETRAAYSKNSRPRQFHVQADTLSATRRKKGTSNNRSIEVRQSAQKKYYSIQIGAFRLESNVAHNKQLLEKRFKQPVIIFYEGGIKMTRMCLGNFPTKHAANTFLASMKEQYPKDYTTAWVAELTK